MKKIFLPIVALFIATSCNQTPKTEVTNAGETQTAATATGTTFTADKSTSKVSFEGAKPVGTHTGDFSLTEGSFSVAEGKISAGKFVIDINSMLITDKNQTMSEKLKKHLLSPDFFDAEKFGTATFEITGSEVLTGDSLNSHKISGNLTLKDSTRNVSFPAKITVADSTASATASFTIDRTQWGLFYGNDKSLGDKFIYPEVKIALSIQGKK